MINQTQSFFFFFEETVVQRCSDFSTVMASLCLSWDSELIIMTVEATYFPYNTKGIYSLLQNESHKNLMQSAAGFS